MKYLALALVALVCLACARQDAGLLPPPPVSAAQVRVPAGPGVAVSAIPYARPDLSSDPAERAKAYAMREALVAQDVRTARQLATTRALREMFNEEQAGRANRVPATE